MDGDGDRRADFFPGLRVNDPRGPVFTSSDGVRSGLCGVLDVLGFNRLFRRLNRGRIKVLLYHRISDFEAFESQLDHFSRFYSFTHLDQEGRWGEVSTDRPNLLLTFDDGSDTDLRVAERLHARGIRACFFLISRCLPAGTLPPHLIERGIENPDERRTLDASQAARLSALGHTVGCHSLNHDDYSKLDSDSALSDAALAAEELRKLLNLPVTLLALPWGRPPKGGPETLLRGFKMVFTVEHGFNDVASRIILRNAVISSAQGAATASGALDFFRRIFQPPRA